MAGLMKRAFADPHYQRYRYRPDCRLHSRRRSTLPTLSSSVGDDRRRNCLVKSVAARPQSPAAVVVVAFVLSTLAVVSNTSSRLVVTLRTGV